MIEAIKKNFASEAIEKNFTPEAIVVVGLVTALLTSIGMGMNELAMSIASGLVGYIGRGKSPQS